jgi:hypothetical protein
MQHEYFVVMNSNAAPICSDTSSRFVLARTPAEALATACMEYKHPAGLYSAAVYRDANAKEKGEPILAEWWGARARKERGIA